MVHRENGTLWVWEQKDGLPAVYRSQTAAEFGEATIADYSQLARIMGQDSEDIIVQRLRRCRCFVLQAEGQIVTYGWVSQASEWVGELERQFNLAEREAYIWDCGTVPLWRGRGCYSDLLSRLIYQLAGEGVPRIWIGASRENRPSVRGFSNAGFRPVLDLAYHRLFRLTLVQLQPDPAADRPIFEAAVALLRNNHERRWGRLLAGFKLS